MKTCIKCKETKELSCFTKDKNRADGLYVYCKECTSSSVKRSREVFRKKFYDYKVEKGCEMCGYNEHRAALQFDHIDPSTKVDSVANLISQRTYEEVIWAEIAKCRVLCANCHAVHTHG